MKVYQAAGVEAQEAASLLGDDVVDSYLGHPGRRIEAKNLKPPDEGDMDSLVFTVRSTDPPPRFAIWLAPADAQVWRGVGDSAQICCMNPKAAWAKLVVTFFQPMIQEAAREPVIDGGAYIHPSAQVGSEGLSLVHAINGKRIHVPHVGRVRLSVGVRVGANTVIHRGVLTDTVIDRDTTIGALVNIGHGVQIGYGCLVAPMTTIGGSARIGDNVTIWQGVKIANKVRIGNDSIIGMGSVVLKDVPAGETWAGVPAARIK